MTDTLELTVIARSALPTILAADADDILGSLARKVAAFQPDASTPAGREEMRSLAYEIARTRTKLDNLGKSLGEDAKRTIDALNAERRVLRDRLEELQDQVRAPLTEWETREKRRVQEHEAELARIGAGADFSPDAPAADLAVRLETLRAWPARDWEEFATRASGALAVGISKTEAAHAAAVKREAEAAELARHRAEAAAREQQEREARIAAEAADRARREAEEAAQAREAEAARKAQAEREAAAQRERDAQEALAKAERDRAAALEQAERDRIAAAAKAKRDQDAAVEAERRRAEAEASAARAAAARRAEDVAHRTSFNREAVAALVTLDLTEDQAKAIVTAIAKSLIPHVSISY